MWLTDTGHAHLKLSSASHLQSDENDTNLPFPPAALIPSNNIRITVTQGSEQRCVSVLSFFLFLSSLGPFNPISKFSLSSHYHFCNLRSHFTVILPQSVNFSLFSGLCLTCPPLLVITLTFICLVLLYHLNT